MSIELRAPVSSYWKRDIELRDPSQLSSMRPPRCIAIVRHASIGIAHSKASTHSAVPAIPAGSVMPDKIYPRLHANIRQLLIKTS